MWKIFFNQEENYLTVLQAVENWKIELFNIIQNEIKQYFAKKVVTYFDNLLMFQQKQKKEIHTCLLESLSQAEKEMQDIGGLFGRIEIYLVKEDQGVGLISFGLEDRHIYSLQKYGFSIVKNNAKITDSKLISLKQISWSSLVFDVDLINYAINWIDWAPNLEERAKAQATYLLMTTYYKSNLNLTMKEKIEFEEKIENHPKYTEIYQKVYRLMPKIEIQLEEEWKNTVDINKLDSNFGKIKKTKM
jgi:hypothetical protein